MIRFASPTLLLVTLPLLLWVLFRVRSLPSAGLWRRRGTQVAMALGMLAVSLAAGGLEIGLPVDRVAVVFALDRSRSVGEGSEQVISDIEEAIEGMQAEDRAGLIVFGARPETETLPSPRPPISPSRAPVPRDSTDIGAALRRALADLPEGYAARVVLLSDGVENRGDASEAALLAASRGVPIDVLPIERPAHAELGVEQVRAPSVVRPDEPIDVRVVTRATHATRARVRLMRDGATILEGETDLAAGRDVLLLRDRAPEAGNHRYDVLVEALDEEDDLAHEDDVGSAFVRIVGDARALVLAGDVTDAAPLAEVLGAAGFEVDLRDARGIPPSLAALSAYDLLVLSDLNSRAFSESQLLDVAAYTRDLGGGLLMVGARESFGLGGYARTPVEDVLPVILDLRRRRDRLSLAMVMAIDKSGSMGMEVDGGRTKLDLANEAAARSAELLSPGDRVAVAHVDTEVDWTQPMTSVSEPEEIAARVRRASAGGGGIYVDTTLEQAYGELRDEATQLRHLLLFSDGSDSEEMSRARSLTRAANTAGITTSVVSMGVGSDTPALEELSRLGGGRFYVVEDMRELPRIFTEETIEASRAALSVDPVRAAPASPGAPTRGVDFDSAPALGGHAVTEARGRATTLLEVGEGDPLLTTWQIGLGRAGAFTCDAGSELGRPWLAWPGYEALFSQLARDLARSPESEDARVAVDIEEGRGVVRVEAVDRQGRYTNYLDLEARVATPTGETLVLPLEQSGSGRYEARFDADSPGAYMVGVGERDASRIGHATAVRPTGVELAGKGTDHPNLARIAAISGGRVRTELAELFEERSSRVHARRPVWPELLAFAMLAMLASVALRRLHLPAGLFEKRRASRRPVEDAGDGGESLGALVAGKRERREAVVEDAGEAPSAWEGYRAATGQASEGGGDEGGSEAPDVDGPGTGSESEDGSLAERLLDRKKRRR